MVYFARNAAAEEIFAFSRLPESDRNVLLNVMINARDAKKTVRRVIGAEEARRILAQFLRHPTTWGPAIPRSATCSRG